MVAGSSGARTGSGEANFVGASTDATSPDQSTIACSKLSAFQAPSMSSVNSLIKEDSKNVPGPLKVKLPNGDLVQELDNIKGCTAPNAEMWSNKYFTDSDMLLDAVENCTSVDDLRGWLYGLWEDHHKLRAKFYKRDVRIRCGADQS